MRLMPRILSSTLWLTKKKFRWPFCVLNSFFTPFYLHINKRMMNIKPRWILDNFRVFFFFLSWDYVIIISSFSYWVKLIFYLLKTTPHKNRFLKLVFKWSTPSFPAKLILPPSRFSLITFNVLFTLFTMEQKLLLWKRWKRKKRKENVNIEASKQASNHKNLWLN